MHPINPSLPHVCHGPDSAESVEWYDPIVESEAFLSDRDLDGALNRTRKQMDRAVQLLSSPNEGPSDLTNLRGRVQALEGQLQALEHKVIERMLRAEQTALAPLIDLTPQPPSIWCDLPPELEINVLSFLETADLVGLSESRQRGLAAPARGLLRGVATEHRRLIADTPLLQELTAGTSKPSDVSVGQYVLQLQNDLRNGLERLPISRVAELVDLYQSISIRLSQSTRPPEQRALQAIKAELVGRLGKCLHRVPELHNNREIVLAAVQHNGLALQYASAALRNDPVIVRAAVQRDGPALEYASEDLRNDPEIVRAAVQQNGRALEFASEDLRNDPVIVLAAVQQNGMALQYASADMRNDPVIVRAAVQQNCWALEYAAAELRADPAIVLAAMQQNRQALGMA
jgi:hypothetical protein